MDNNTQTKRLYRSRTDRVIAGVCGGLGDHFGIDPIIFRIVFLLLVLGGGSGILIYIILALVVPNEPQAGQPHDANRPWGQGFSENVRQNAQDLAQGIKNEANRSGNDVRIFLGTIIVIIGFLILFSRILPIHWFRWDLFWPLLLIFFGVLIIARRR